MKSKIVKILVVGDEICKETRAYYADGSGFGGWGGIPTAGQLLPDGIAKPPA